jgi:hypothetical protein
MACRARGVIRRALLGARCARAARGHLSGNPDLARRNGRHYNFHEVRRIFHPARTAGAHHQKVLASRVSCSACHLASLWTVAPQNVLNAACRNPSDCKCRVVFDLGEFARTKRTIPARRSPRVVYDCRD